MTAYFDERTAEVASYAQLEGEAFLYEVATIEARVIDDVCLVTGDREFPEDLRERILTAIAVLRVQPMNGLPPTQARDQAKVCKLSPLLGALHSLFHEVASRKIETRFGRLSDSPTANLKARDDKYSEPEPRYCKRCQCTERDIELGAPCVGDLSSYHVMNRPAE